jgi:DNA-binding transcriptional ArsR family regulator
VVADNAPTRITDPQVMRALAHPARLAILTEMHGGRAGTATEFADVCGLSPSATSYHLRALAKAGLVTEAPGRGDGRERLWRAAEATTGLQVGAGPAAGTESLRAEQEFVLVFLAAQDAKARDWLARWQDEGQEWYDAASFSGSVIHATPDELLKLRDELLEMLRPYGRTARPEPPPGARTVDVVFRTIPRPAP